MKTTLVIFFFLITGVTYSQIHYIEVAPKHEKQYERKEGYYDNASGFAFDISDYYYYKKCIISGYLSDPSLTNEIVIKTGWDYEYTEASTTC